MERHPGLVVAIGVVFTSLSAVLIRLSDAPPLAIATWRMALASLLLTPIYARARLARPAAEPAESAPSARALLLSLASGLFLALHFGFWITSLEYTSVASSTVLVTTHPILVGFAGMLLLRERLRLTEALAMLGALGGSVLLVGGGLAQGGTAPLGNLLAFLGAVAVSGYIILGRLIRRRLTATSYTMIVYPTAALLLGIAAAVGRVPLWPYGAREITIFAALAVFCTLLGHSLFNWALKFVKPTLVSTSILGEPVIASLLALLLFAEVPAPTTVVGGIIILACIGLFVRVEAAARRSA